MRDADRRRRAYCNGRIHRAHPLGGDGVAHLQWFGYEGSAWPLDNQRE